MPKDRSHARDHFRHGGKAYATFRPSYPPRLVESLAALAPDRSLALDVGCGTGQLSRLLAEHFDRVVAIDVSHDQIAHAAKHARILYLVGPAETLGLGASTTSLIAVAQAAHWLDLPQFYAEARRVAVRDAVLALICYGVISVDGPLSARLQDFYWRDLSGYWPAERRHVETGYADLPFPFAELEPPLCQIERSWPLNGLLGFIETWSAVKRARARGDDACIDAFIADARRLWAPPDRRYTVTWPIMMRLGRL